MEWSGVEWSGVEWSGVEWSGVEWSGVEWSGVEWSGVEWSGVEWSGVEWSGVEWSGVESLVAQRIKERAKVSGWLYPTSLAAIKSPNQCRNKLIIFTSDHRKKLARCNPVLPLQLGSLDATSVAECPW